MIAATDPYVHWYWLAGLLLTAIGIGTPFWLNFGRKWMDRRRARMIKLDQVIEKLLGKPPTFEDPDPAPGLMETVRALRVEVEAVKLQVTPNGGNTRRLGDRIVRVEKALGIDVPDD